MKKLLLLAILCVSTTVLAQKTASKIPSDASVVATVKGENILQLLSMEELNNSFFGSEILKEANRGDLNVNSLDDFGFNLKASAHYFMQANDSVNHNVFIVGLKDVNQFEDFFKKSGKVEIVSQNGVKTIKDENGPAIVWNNNTLVMVASSTNELYFQDEAVLERYGLQSENVYGDWPETIPPPPPAPSNSEEAAAHAVDAARDATETYEEEIEETVIESTETYEEEVEETVIESTEYGTDDSFDYVSNYTIKRELTDQWSKLKAIQILTQSGSKSNSILTNKSYLKSLDSKAEATVWVKDFGQIYSDLLGGYYGSQLDGLDLAKLYAGNSLSAKLLLEDDKMVLSTDYTMSDDMAESYKKMTARKLNKKFLNYVNEDRMIGYMSYSIDTKGTLEEYPVLMNKMLSTMPYYGEEASLGIDLFSLLLDEEAVANVIKGDLLFLLSGISKQEVTYTSYEYDDDYEYVEVEKTKTETIPDFLVMASSGDTKLLKKSISYLVNKEMVTFANGIYTFKEPRSPLSIHLTIKDGIVFLGTSEVEMRKITTGTFDAKVSSTHKKRMLNNSYSVFVSAKQLGSQLPIDEMGIDRDGKLQWFLDTSKDAYVTASRIKGNTLTSEMVVEVPPTEENALKYIFNIIEKFIK
ncbi:hypothetical protein [Olleya sp. R77988]|uniref:hypothetical protein n=1 Tax=Olleya sp. R77988 TaxID=3093875 RepID=UPI0037C5C897